MTSRLVLRQLQRHAASCSAVMTRTRSLNGLEPTQVVRHQLTLFAATIPARRYLSSEAGKKEDDLPKEPEARDVGEEVAAEEASEEPAEEAAAPEPTKEELLEAQLKEMKDQLLRSYAEQENTRRIAARDVDSAKQFAIKSFAKSLLDVSDNLTRALEAVPEEALNDKSNVVLATLHEGIEMTHRGLMKAFEVNGLVKFGEVGEIFDPNKHEALYEYPDSSKTPRTVGQVMKPGYLLNKRVLRPAEVGVVKEGQP